MTTRTVSTCRRSLQVSSISPASPQTVLLAVPLGFFVVIDSVFFTYYGAVDGGGAHLFDNTGNVSICGVQGDAATVHYHQIYGPVGIAAGGGDVTCTADAGTWDVIVTYHGETDNIMS